MSRFCVSLIAMAAVMMAGAAGAAERAGVAAAVLGDVSVEGATRQAAETVVSGMDLVLEDRLATGANSRTQAILIDETTLTLGPDSELTIDKFVFDPDGSTSEISANFVKGAMRFVSGRIGAIAPQRVNVRTPVGTLGIRGTIAFAVTQPAGVFFGLLGPSRGNDLKSRNAGIEFENDKGKQETYKTGYGFLVPEGEGPGAVGPIPQDVLKIVENDFRIRPDAPGQDAPVNYSGSVSGRDRAVSFITASDFVDIKQRDDENDDVVEEVVEELLDNAGDIINLQNIIAEVGIFDFRVFDSAAIDNDEISIVFTQGQNTVNFGNIVLVDQGSAQIRQLNLDPGSFQFEFTGVKDDFSTVTFEVLTPLINGPQQQFFDLDKGDKAILNGEAQDLSASL